MTPHPTPRRTAAIFVAMLLALATQSAQAGDYASYFVTDPCAEQRAGYPQRVGIVAAPSNTRNYGGYYVGGGNIGAAGGPRTVEQGTWGWDYGGLFKNNWVRLGWNDGSRKQGGVGSYKTNFAPRQK